MARPSCGILDHFRNCVSLIVTDVAVIQVTPEGLLLRELEHEWGVTAVACRALSRAESLALREV